MRRKIGVLIDLSGTIHIEDTAVPGAVQALEKLRRLEHVRLKFVTNTTKESGRVLHERLTKLGFGIHPSEIYTSLIAARNFVKEKGLRPMLMLEPEAMEDFQGIETSNPNAVVIGLAPSQFHYDRLNEAFNLILNNSAQLIGIHKARYFKRTHGLALGPGAFVTALEYATDKKAVVLGKPEKSFFLGALNSLRDYGQNQGIFLSKKLLERGGSPINYVTFARKLASLVRAREEISDGRAMATERFALRSHSPAIRNFLPGSYERSELSRSEALALRNLWEIPNCLLNGPDFVCILDATQ